MNVWLVPKLRHGVRSASGQQKAQDIKSFSQSSEHPCKSVSSRFSRSSLEVSPKTLKARSTQIYFSSTTFPDQPHLDAPILSTRKHVSPRTFLLSSAISVKIFIEPPATATLDGFMMMTLLTAIVSIIQNEFVDVCTFVLIKLFKLSPSAARAARALRSKLI